MHSYWKTQYGNPHSSDHILGWRAAEVVNEAAQSVAIMIGADSDEIVFTSGATEANNLAVLGLARAQSIRRRILVSAIEHKCVLATVRALAQHNGYVVETIPVDQEGFVDLDYLESRSNESVFLVSIMAVNNEIGTIQDIPKISRILKQHSIFFHCDAAQAPSAMDISGLTQHVDLLSLSGHKMYASQGIGVLYIRREIQPKIEPLIYGGGQQNNLRSGTVPVPLCVGMGAASEIASSREQVTERRKVTNMRDDFVRLLKDENIPVIINGPTTDKRHPGNANLCFDGYNAQDILSTLQPHVAASTGAACTSGIPESSHVLQAIGLSIEQSNASVRFSFGRFTTTDEIIKMISKIKHALSTLEQQ